MPSSDRTEHPAASVQDETAAWAFADAILALNELGHTDTVTILARRWPGHEDVLAKAGVTSRPLDTQPPNEAHNAA